ncbi:MAG: MotA/TolQ/ExbB proton channel family protein [Muribaculaceae bacterium]|nr:MotA/TolQ/ExbB proton channel family protein [Muribaculaceae bacterium]
MLLLQIPGADTVAAAFSDTMATVAAAETETVQILAEESADPVTSLSLWDLCLQGGWTMIPLAILLLLAIYIFAERCIVLTRAGRSDSSFMKRIKGYIHEGELESAQNLCKQAATPQARLIAKGISRIGRPMNDVLVAIENTGNLEVSNLSKGLPWLATTAAGAPMLGFLGTVIGMVQAFYAIAQSGSSATIDSFAGGIYSALVTTVAGLIVGVLALFAYNFLVARVNKIMNRLEAATMEFMDLLNEPVA